MGFTLKKRLMHARAIGTDANGKTKYDWTQIGCIIEDEDGNETVIINLMPPSSGRKDGSVSFRAWDPAPKTEAELTTPSGEADVPF